jgi:hypothetical protein
MAGEYQLAQKVLDSGIESARDNDGMDEITFARALMYQLLEHNKKTREDKDIIGELEQHIRSIQDGGESVITRGD